MKKTNNLGLFLVMGFLLLGLLMITTSIEAFPNQQVPENSDVAQKENPYEVVIKTYFLKHIDPDALYEAAKLYIQDATAHKNSISVRILRKNIPDFEALLKKLDVEKKTVLFKIFTVIASKEELKEEDEVIENKNLRRVLDELRSLWNFKSYKVEGPSFLSAKEDSGANSFRLVSSVSFFNMLVMDVDVKDEEPGKRIVSIGQIQLKWRLSVTKVDEQVLIDTKEISLKEGGYLVAGISGYGFPSQDKAAKALILVINAEIK